MQQQYTVTDRATGEQFLCYEDESIYAGMRRTKKGHIQHGCGTGACGTCKVQILEGEFLAFKKMSPAKITKEERKKNIVLACCVKPRSDITLC